MAGAKYHPKKDTVANQQTGYSVNCFIADQAEATTIAGTVSPVVDAKDKYRIEDDHVFGVDQGFIKCYGLPEVNEANAATYGSLGALNIAHTHKLFFPGDKVELQTLMDHIMNADLLLLVEDATSPGGPTWQYGDAKIPANIESIAFTSGNAFEGRKGYEVTLKAKCRYQYEGTVTQMA